MVHNNINRKNCNITERFCAHIGENVVLRSTSPENKSYECLYSPFCDLKGCERYKHAKSKE